MFTQIQRTIKQHGQILVYTLGSAIVACWTLLRFFDQRMTFDLVGQQVLAHQWLHGGLSGATIGPTNYILKMLFLYIPLDYLPGSPRLKLILLALAISITTFILISILLRRLLVAFGVVGGNQTQAALLWFSVLAGSVFWVQFSNSRNLEVVGGLWLVERSVRFFVKPSRGLLAAITTLAAILFFADSLQLYMAALPVLLYGSIGAIHNSRYRKQVLMLAGAIGLGFAISKLFMSLATDVFLVHFLSGRAPSPGWSVHTIVRSTRGTLVAYGHLFAGAGDAGRVREAANLLLTGLLALGFMYGAATKRIPKRLTVFVATFVATDSLVYIASGQALIAGTSRYLIMVAPLVILAAGSLDMLAKSQPILWQGLLAVTCLVIVINIFSLSRSLSSHWNTSFPLDAHLASVERFKQQYGYRTIYASMDSAMPLNYLGHTTSYLPLNCTGERLISSDLFFDKSAQKQATAALPAIIPVVLDGNSITNTPSVCTVADITNQLGQPEQTQQTDDGSVVLLYTAGTLKIPLSFN